MRRKWNSWDENLRIAMPLRVEIPEHLLLQSFIAISAPCVYAISFARRILWCIGNTYRTVVF